MSKRISVRLTNRQPEDLPQLIEMIVEACPSNTDVEFLIDCQPGQSAPGTNQRVDEHLGAKVRNSVGGELDRLAELAVAVKKYEEDRPKEAVQGRTKELAGYKTKLKKWFADTALQGWRCAVWVIIGDVLRGGGPI